MRGDGAARRAVSYSWPAVIARRKLMAAALAGMLVLAVLAPGCGGGGDNGAQAPPPVAKPEDFPKPGGTSLRQLQKQYGMGGPVLSPSVSQFGPGKNRFGFGLFDRARAQIADAPVALYVAPVRGGAVSGPFPAHYESLKVEPQFLSRTVASDTGAAKSLYVADLEFHRPGEYLVLGLARLDDRLVAATPAGPPLRVAKAGGGAPAGPGVGGLSQGGRGVPKVGTKAPRTHTPTKTDVAGDLSKIDTRSPPDDMHDTDFADVLGKKPVMLLFATPALCQSRVCGPVVDIAEQVKNETGGKGAAWIHMEIYNNNEIAKGIRPQVVQWGLPTEPWLFAIDKTGRIAARLEGAFSARELKQALEAATKG
jgi:hypothetical protein